MFCDCFSIWWCFVFVFQEELIAEHMSKFESMTAELEQAHQGEMDELRQELTQQHDSKSSTSHTCSQLKNVIFGISFYRHFFCYIAAKSWLVEETAVPDKITA